MLIFIYLKIPGVLLMNYYERIQRAIEYLEANLENPIDINAAAQQAYMSVSNFYRMFFALIGFSVKEYVRLRRISLAAFELQDSSIGIIDLAVKYDFDSGDSFSRAFKRITGSLPSEFRKRKKIYSFERMNLMEKYFEIQDKELLNKYPDIKVLKKLEPMKVAYYNYFGINPEHNAFKVIATWMNNSGLGIDKQKNRVFGYNNPSPTSTEQSEYGYEVCVTIEEHFQVNDPLIKTKYLEGGLYAVTGVKKEDGKDLGQGIMETWSRFNNWLSESKYIFGGHQWLEEHLGFDEEFNHIGGIDIYMPISEKGSTDLTKTFEIVQPMWAATYTAHGTDAKEKARAYFLKWADNEGLLTNNTEHRIFAYYNHDRFGQKDFFFKMNISVNKEFITKDESIVIEEFQGGLYAVMKSQFKYNGWAWGEFMSWVSKSKEYDFGDYWFFEEYKINKPIIDSETDMVLYMPIKEKKVC